MYIPKVFKQDDAKEIYELIRCYPLATLVCNDSSGLNATHIPFILAQSNNGKGVLQAHIAKTNPLWQNVNENSNVLVVFNGPSCYISPNYYPSKEEDGRAVPTWNYVTAHLQGKISFVHDEKWILNMIDQLTAQQEATQPEPWSSSDAPEKYIDRMLQAVVGIEIEIESSEGKWKLSQNHSDKNKAGVVSSLSQQQDSDSQNIAALIETQLNAD